MNIEAYDSSKDIQVQKLGQNLHSVNKPEEEESFVGANRFNIQRKQSNNMYLKDGPKRFDRSPNYKPAPHNPKSFQKKVSPRKNYEVKKATPGPNRNLNQNRSNFPNSGTQVIKDAKLASLFKEDDFFLPPIALNCEVKRVTKEENGKRIRKVSKLFTLKNGKKELHEEIFVERI